MIGDTKNTIGQQVANPGQPDNRQIDLFRKQIMSIQLPDDNNRIVDMLSMDQFGHNASVLRQGMSIVEAKHVNSDRQYGVLQCEDEFQFTPTLYDSINDSDTPIGNSYPGWIINYPRQAVSGKSVSSVAESLTNVNSTNNAPSYAIPSLRFIERTGPDNSSTEGKYHNVQHIHCHSGTTTHVFNDGVASHTMQDANIPATLNNDYTLNGQAYGDRRDIGSQILECEIRVVNYSNKPIFGSIRTYDPTSYTGWQEIPSGQNLSFSTGSANTARLEGLAIMFKYNGTYFPIDIQAYASMLRNITFSIKTGSSQCRVAGRQIGYDRTGDSWTWQSLTSVTGNGNVVIPQSFVYPKCDITFRVRDSNGWHESFIGLSNVSVSSGKYDVAVGSIANPSVRDMTYLNYFLGSHALNSTIKYTSRMISSQLGNSNSFDSVLSIPETLSEYVLVSGTSPIVRSRMDKFHKLVNIIDNLDIGLIERLNGHVQFGVMFNGVCYSARSDAPIPKSKFKLYKFKVISIGNNKVSFLSERNVINGDSTIKSKTLFNFHPYFDYDGGMLVESYRDLYDFYAVDCNTEISKTISDMQPVPGDMSLILNAYSTNDIMFKQSINSIRITAINTGSTMCMHSPLLLNASVSELIGLGKYVIKNTSIPFPTGYNLHIQQTTIDAKTSPLRSYVSGPVMTLLTKIPSTGADTKEFNSLPLRMLDEYPAIFNNNKVGDDNIVLGKSRFVTSNGDLYQASEFLLVCNSDSPLLIGGGRILSDGGRVYVTNNNLTEIYSYSEFGFNKLMVLEDVLLCNPVSTSSGVVMCCKNGIYSMSQEYGVRKIWSSPTLILNASLRTVLDNCCIAIIDNGQSSNSKIRSSNGVNIVSSSGSYITSPSIEFTAVIINQQGYVSSQVIKDNGAFVSTEFVDTGSSSDLIIIDLYGSKPISKLSNIPVDENEVYSIESNQSIEQYGPELIKGKLNSIAFFAKGTGTVSISLNGLNIGSVNVNSLNDFSRYRISVTNTNMDMLSYKLTASRNVKLMQKILGTINVKRIRYSNN